MLEDPTCSAAPSPAIQRYSRDMAIAGGLYAAAVIGVVVLLARLQLPQAVAALIALAPVVPALLMLRAYLVLFRSLDEFQKRVQSEAILLAAGLVGFAAFGYGFLAEFAGFPHVSLIYVLPAMIATWGIAQTFVGRRYR